MSNENGISPYTNIIEEYTQAESPSQPYKPALKKLWKMEISTDEGESLSETNQGLSDFIQDFKNDPDRIIALNSPGKRRKKMVESQSTNIVSNNELRIEINHGK